MKLRIGIILAFALLGLGAVVGAWQIGGSPIGARAGAAPSHRLEQPLDTPTPTATPPICAGGWTFVDSPNGGTGGNTLHGVAGTSDSDIWAVGQADSQTVILHWNGTAWTVVPSPNPGTFEDRLNGVAALAPNDAWAVGEAITTTQLPLMVHWDGNSWTALPSSDPGQPSELASVSAVSSTDVWAVGYLLSGPTLIEHWNGSQWSIVASPDPGYAAQLEGVSAVAANDVWAAGYMNIPSGRATLIEHWNGTAWAIVPSPNPAATLNELFGLLAVSAQDIWALGDQGTPPNQTLIVHWDGADWSVVSSPQPYNQGLRLHGASATASSDVWAVGGYGTGCGYDAPLILHWDGSSWQLVDSPEICSNSDDLYGVAAFGPAAAWAVGQAITFQPPRSVYTLIDHYTGACGPPGTPSASPTSAPSATPPPSATASASATLTRTATRTPTAGPSPTPTCGPPAWVVRSPLPYTAEAPAAAGAGSYIYTFGGSSDTSYRADTDRYDPAANTWTALAPAPQAFYAGVAVYGQNGKIYVFGGYTDQFSNVTRIYDIASDTWSNGAAMPGVRTGASAGYYNGHIYVAGGFDGNDTQTQLWAYDLTNNTWDTTLAALPQPVEHAGFGVIGSRFYVAGGDNAGESNLDTLYAYDFTSHIWSTLASLPEGISDPGSAATGGQLWIFGGVWPPLGAVPGLGQIAPHSIPTTYIYDPPTNGWTTGPDLTQSRASLVGATTGPYLVAIAGLTASGPVNTVEVLAQSPCGTATPTVIAPTNTVSPTTTRTPNLPTGTRTSTPAPVPSQTPPPATHSPTPLPTQTPGGPSATPMPSDTPTLPPSHTPTPLPTQTPGGPTATPCAINFSDVHPTDYFYTAVTYLACHGVISGYGDSTFRPFAQTTRGQMVKIVVLGFQKPITTPTGGEHTFADVPTTFPFFAVIETAAAGQIVSGYACGGAGEPCDAEHRPYFRPYANVTRGQLSKIDVVAAGWALQNPATGTFADVAPGSAFYSFVETAACHAIISGYACGGAGEPCDPTQRPYFRQYNNATRGQIAKIVYLSLGAGAACSPGGSTP